jgi:CubicO group peptidase (beta-lactamase class C family)
MRDSFYRLPADMRHRRVYRKPGLPGTEPISWLPGSLAGCDSCESPEFDELDLGNNGVTSTARDLAVFLQMLLNAGSHGDRRILSPASVAAMTRPHVDSSTPHLLMFLDPATGQRVEVEYPGGSYGYGLFVFAEASRFSINGSLASSSAFGHSGYFGAYMWADPEHGIVGVSLAVPTRLKRGHPVWNSDLFVNAVYGAVVE